MSDAPLSYPGPSVVRRQLQKDKWSNRHVFDGMKNIDGWLLFLRCNSELDVI